MIRHGAFAALIALLVLTGCDPAMYQDDGESRVVATTTQVGQVAAELGGDDIQITTLLSPGVEAHDFELTPDAAGAIERADLI
ncbi:MAG TPA: zinc ABC transporter substrate-binding protein, partial [Candidatus Limnocylindria bacterium]|nr:zinc ABC transporter substrate-binding protein [Candidatus Limnocylindria bacterium]